MRPLAYFLLLIALTKVASLTSSCNFVTNYCFAKGIVCPSSLSAFINISPSPIPSYEFDVISFGSFVLNGGIVQGRVAVNQTLSALNGVSFGDQIYDNSTTNFTLVVGEDINWYGDGGVYPTSSMIFVGGMAALPSYIAPKISARCPQSDCLKNDFQNIFNYYDTFSGDTLNPESSSTVITQLSSGGMLYISCYTSSNVYQVSISSFVFSNITDYTIGSTCNSKAIWLFNIGGVGSVTFKGNSFPSSMASDVIYNIFGSAARAIVIDSFVYGNILSPYGRLAQNAGGSIQGQVIVSQVRSGKDFVRPICSPRTPSLTTSAITTSAVSTGAISTGQVMTTSPLTTGPITMTTSQVTSASEITTQVVTSSQIVATGTLTASPLTTGTRFTTAARTGGITGQHLTTSRVGSQTTTTSSVSSTTSRVSTTTSTSRSSTTTGSGTVNLDCPFFDFNAQCSGLGFTIGNITTLFSNFHVISFRGYQTNIGEIQGRAAINGTLIVQSSLSIGTQVRTSGSSATDRFSEFSLIALNTLWSSGSLLPDGNGATSAEKAYIASSESVVPDSVKPRVVTNTCNDCIAKSFDSAHRCYSSIQQSLAAFKPTANATLVNTGLTIMCDKVTNPVYIVDIPDTLFNQAAFFTLSNCGANSAYIVNISGSGNVTFSSDGFPARPENILYNILGAGRMISVTSAVNGAILAPRNILNQQGGIIRGKIIVESVVSAGQIAKPVCSFDGFPSPTTTGLNNGDQAISSSSSSVLGYSWIYLYMLIAISWIRF